MSLDLFTPQWRPSGHPFAAQQLRTLADEFDAQAAAQLTTQSVLRNCAEQARDRADQLDRPSG